MEGLLPTKIPNHSMGVSIQKMEIPLYRNVQICVIREHPSSLGIICVHLNTI